MVNRNNPDFLTDKVKEVLPAFFAEDYPRFIQFLDEYYKFLSTDSAHNFGKQIKDLLSIRDVHETSEENLDRIIQEIGNGLKSANFFRQPRLMATLLADFYSSKGNENSIEGFFRGFFGEEVEIEYPKHQIFRLNDPKSLLGTGPYYYTEDDVRILGDSIAEGDEILGGYGDLNGTESVSTKYLQNDKLYQIFSILIKINVTDKEYVELYKKFVHPAGFYVDFETRTVQVLTWDTTEIYFSNDEITFDNDAFA